MPLQSGGPNEIGTFRKVNLVRNNEVAATLDLYDILTRFLAVRCFIKRSGCNSGGIRLKNGS
jgi:hypothetical protein